MFSFISNIRFNAKVSDSLIHDHGIDRETAAELVAQIPSSDMREMRKSGSAPREIAEMILFTTGGETLASLERQSASNPTLIFDVVESLTNDHGLDRDSAFAYVAELRISGVYRIQKETGASPQEIAESIMFTATSADSLDAIPAHHPDIAEAIRDVENNREGLMHDSFETPPRKNPAGRKQ